MRLNKFPYCTEDKHQKQLSDIWLSDMPNDTPDEGSVPSENDSDNDEIPISHCKTQPSTKKSSGTQAPKTPMHEAHQNPPTHTGRIRDIPWGASLSSNIPPPAITEGTECFGSTMSDEWNPPPSPTPQPRITTQQEIIPGQTITRAGRISKKP
jgi:hypothetical protein